MATTVATDDLLALLALKQDGSALPFDVSYFKIGEGGWKMVGVAVTRDPDKTLHDLDCVENPGHYPVQSRYVFQKVLLASEVQVIAPGVCQVNCTVSSGEANDDGYGNDPEFWELGVFTSDNRMICHRTFSKQIKDGTRALRHEVIFTYQQG